MEERDEPSAVGLLKKTIAEYVDECFDEVATGLLLSRLGQTLAKKHPELRQTLGTRKLAEFIEEEMAESVQVLTSPENGIVRIALPARVTVDGDVLQFFPRRDTTAGSSAATPRYSRAFWAAFSQPLAAGQTRLVEFEPHVHFVDVEGAAPASKKVVAREFIVDEVTEPDLAMRGKQIAANIARWLHANFVDVELVSAKVEGHVAGTRAAGSKGSLLEVLLSALGEADLKRIQMPLDVVAKLHNRFK